MSLVLTWILLSAAASSWLLVAWNLRRPMGPPAPAPPAPVPPPRPVTLREAEQVSTAHDVLLCFMRDVGPRLPIDRRREIASQMMVLCWVCGHDDTFGNAIVSLIQSSNHAVTLPAAAKGTPNA